MVAIKGLIPNTYMPLTRTPLCPYQSQVVRIFRTPKVCGCGEGAATVRGEQGCEEGAAALRGGQGCGEGAAALRGGQEVQLL